MTDEAYPSLDEFKQSEWAQTCLEVKYAAFLAGAQTCDHDFWGFLNLGEEAIQKSRAAGQRHGFKAFDSLGAANDDVYIPPLPDGSGGNMPTHLPHDYLVATRWDMVAVARRMKEKRQEMKNQQESITE